MREREDGPRNLRQTAQEEVDQVLAAWQIIRAVLRCGSATEPKLTTLVVSHQI